MTRVNGVPLLLADDCRVVRMTFAALLEAANYKIFSAVDGEEALMILLAEPEIQLCLLDVQMPGKTGLEVLILAKQERPSVPVVLMSGDSRYEERALEYGADAFFTKPTPTDLVLETVSRLLQQEH